MSGKESCTPGRRSRNKIERRGKVNMRHDSPEIVIDQHYKGYNPVQFGSQSCAPGHAFGPSVRTHWLLHYVVYGFGIFVRDNVSYLVKPGDIFVIPPYEETYYEADGKNPWRYIWIGFTTEEAVPPPLEKAIVSCPEAGIVFEDMIRCRKMENGRSAFLCAKIWELFSLLLEEGGPSADYVEKALNYMNTEYINDITVQQIAERLGLNRSYFSGLFSRQMGVSPQKYLIHLRLERAAELLAVYGESPATAGFSVGYPDIYHFSKIFKQHFGVSPRKYQQLYSRHK